MFKDKTTLLVLLMAALMIFVGVLLLAASVMLFTAEDNSVQAAPLAPVAPVAVDGDCTTNIADVLDADTPAVDCVE